MCLKAFPHSSEDEGLSGVHLCMQRFELIAKAPSTLTTDIGFLTCMNSHVNLQV